MSLPLSWWRIS